MQLPIGLDRHRVDPEKLHWLAVGDLDLAGKPRYSGQAMPIVPRNKAAFPHRRAGTPRVVDTVLRIYLNDRLAMGVLWREMARRSERNNRGTPAEAVLAEVACAIAEDGQTFRGIMGELGITPNRVKTALALARATQAQRAAHPIFCTEPVRRTGILDDRNRGQKGSCGPPCVTSQV
jgi:hypothetical protein